MGGRLREQVGPGAGRILGPTLSTSVMFTLVCASSLRRLTAAFVLRALSISSGESSCGSSNSPCCVPGLGLGLFSILSHLVSTTSQWRCLVVTVLLQVGEARLQVLMPSCQADPLHSFLWWC